MLAVPPVLPLIHRDLALSEKAIGALSGSPADEIALNLLKQEGIAGIWELYLHAAAVYREGQRDAANSLIEIADAAEEIYRRRIQQAGRGSPPA